MTNYVYFSSTFSSIAMPNLRNLEEDGPLWRLNGPQDIDKIDTVNWLEMSTAWDHKACA